MERNCLIRDFKKYGLIEFYGDIDDSVCPRYKELISNYIKNNNKDIILSFANVSFIDSSGIGLILARYNELLDKNKKIYLKDVNKHIEKLFKISGIYKIIGNYTKEVGDFNE